MSKILVCLILSFTVIPASHAVTFWGSKTSQPVDTDAESLKAGQFIWKGDAIPAGPTVAEINIAQQRIYLYRNGVLIGLSTVSTGKRGHRTPTGTFSVLSRIRHHRSRKYNNAPMPYTHHINRTGIAIHAGRLPGYPASHGCIRLPTGFAKRFFKSSALGMPVIISRGNKSTKTTAAEIKSNLLSIEESFRWQPEKESFGAISILMSKADQRLLVYRNGVEIGRAKILLTEENKSFGSHAYLLHQSESVETNPFLDNNATSAWVAIGLSGHAKQIGTLFESDVLQNIQIPPDFLTAISPVLKAGASLYITDNSILKHEISASALNALLSNPQETIQLAVKTSKTKKVTKIATAALLKQESLSNEIKALQRQIDKIQNRLDRI